MKYRILFEIQHLHKGYPEGKCDEVRLVPSPTTDRLLAAHHCIFRPRVHGGIVYQAVVAEQPFVPFTGAQSFEFGLIAQDPQFWQKTALATEPGQLLRFTNGESQSGAEWELESGTSAPRTAFPASGTLGFVDLDLQEGFLEPGQPAKTFQVQFQALSSYWIYYFMTNRSGENDSFELRDKGKDPVTFREMPQFSDSVMADLALRYPDLKRLRFVSDRRLPYSWVCKDQLYLHLNGQPYPQPLANPASAQFTNLDLGDGKGPEPARFATIKHLEKAPV